eukprot:TRINITY_DN1788_c0_g3_i3.p1 TRINITY_DN1788_c0_g3~~TRINITY_DN1788_c0_g3_i3.p1  ORF type:complete len:361 (+),score=44.63 TRINITY_DN1788_c0_g3_i3:136-1083(+)
MSDDDADEEAWWDRVQSYLSASWPLVAAQCVITPLGVLTDDVEVPEWAQALRVLTIDLDPDFLKRNFIFSERGFKSGRWWTLTSHMLLHESYEHMVENVFGLLLTGEAVWHEFGTEGLMTIFFGGGALAALDRKTKMVQMYSAFNNTLRDIVSRVPQELGALGEKFWGYTSPEVGDWLGQASEQLEKTAGRIATRISPFVSPYVGYLGSSAGVSALAGANICITVEGLLRYIVAAIKGRKHLRASRVAFMVGRACLQLEPFMVEWYLHKHGGFTGIDHAGHLSGFSAGVAMFIVFRLSGVRRGSTAAWFRRLLQR